jgi:hypothetical protein
MVRDGSGLPKWGQSVPGRFVGFEARAASDRAPIGSVAVIPEVERLVDFKLLRYDRSNLIGELI